MLYFSNLDACNQFQWKELKISLYRLLTINPYPIQIIDKRLCISSCQLLAIRYCSIQIIDQCKEGAHISSCRPLITRSYSIQKLGRFKQKMCISSCHSLPISYCPIQTIGFAYREMDIETKAALAAMRCFPIQITNTCIYKTQTLKRPNPICHKNIFKFFDKRQ